MGGGREGGFLEGGGGSEGGGKGPENFQTLHLRDFERPLENTRATLENATPRKAKWRR